MKRTVFRLVGFIGVLALATPARAQVASDSNPAPFRSPNFGQGMTAVPSSRAHGFTVLVNLGIGFQHDYAFGTGGGLAGANVGVGGFVSDQVAILGRFSGTTVSFSDQDITQLSGVVGATAQIWLSRRFAIEPGGGFGIWSVDGGETSDPSVGLILGASGVVFERGPNHLLVGAEWAPVFAADGTVHNFGITFGYQFFRR